MEDVAVCERDKSRQGDEVSQRGLDQDVAHNVNPPPDITQYQANRQPDIATFQPQMQPDLMPGIGFQQASPFDLVQNQGGSASNEGKSYKMEHVFVLLRDVPKFHDYVFHC